MVTGLGVGVGIGVDEPPPHAARQVNAKIDEGVLMVFLRVGLRTVF